MAEQPTPERPDPAAEQATTALIALYVWAEQYLLAQLTRAVKVTVDAATIRYAAVRAARQVVATLDDRTPALVNAVVDAESAAGRRAADAELIPYRDHHESPRGGAGGARPPGTGITGAGDEPFDLTRFKADRAADAIRADLTSELQDVRRRVTRLPDDVYKLIATQGAIAQVLDRNVTPLQAQAAVWQTFVQQGITGFTDKVGRRWTIAAYTEMAVRTAAHRAYLEADLARMQAVGIHLYTIPDEDHACPLCFPWQHRILIDAAYPPPPGVHYDATIDQARAAGLFHPNCRHPLIPVFPGVTRLRPREWGDENQAAYQATQRLRALEREVRKAKAAETHAADPEQAADARRKVRRYQATIRSHVAEHDLNRRRRREQPDLGLATPHLPGAGI